MQLTAAHAGLAARRVSVKDTTSRWGSCTIDTGAIVLIVEATVLKPHARGISTAATHYGAKVAERRSPDNAGSAMRQSDGMGWRQARADRIFWAAVNPSMDAAGKT